MFYSVIRTQINKVGRGTVHGPNGNGGATSGQCQDRSRDGVLVEFWRAGSKWARRWVALRMGGRWH